MVIEKKKIKAATESTGMDTDGHITAVKKIQEKPDWRTTTDSERENSLGVQNPNKQDNSCMQVVYDWYYTYA